MTMQEVQDNNVEAAFEELKADMKSREEHDQDAGDCDLYQEVKGMFEEAGHPDPDAWTLGRLSPDDLKGSPMSYQRLIINRALRPKLGKYEEDTRDQRFLLVDSGSKEDWVDNLKPTINFITKRDKKSLESLDDEVRVDKGDNDGGSN